MMTKFKCFILLITALLGSLNAVTVTYEDCMAESKERHCLIEWMARDRWPHTIKYRYNRGPRDCILLRWADRCGASKDPNHFDSYQACKYQCGGYE